MPLVAVLINEAMMIFMAFECGLTKKAEPPPTRDVNRDSGTDSANGGWLRRLVRHHHNDITLAISSFVRNSEPCTAVSNVAFKTCACAQTRTPRTHNGSATMIPSNTPPRMNCGAPSCWTPATMPTIATSTPKIMPTILTAIPMADVVLATRYASWYLLTTPVRFDA